MTDWSELERLPADILTQRTSRAVFSARGDLAAPLAAAGFSLNSLAELPASELAGRNPLGEIVVGDQRFLVRYFAHGGLLRWLTGRRYWNPLRPFRELALSRRLIALGFRVPEVVAARARKSRGGTWELELVSRRLEGSVDLGSVLLRGSRGTLAPAIERRCARAFGALVRDLHRREFLHGDLTPRNVLVEGATLPAAEPRLWLIDLDGSKFVVGLSAELRAKNLSRLWRHVARMQAAGQAPRAPRLCAEFLRGYGTSGRARRELVSEISEQFRRARGWHGAAELLERAVGARRSQPLS